MFFLGFTFSDMSNAHTCTSGTKVESTITFIPFFTILAFLDMLTYIYISYFSVYKGRAESITR